MVMENKEVLERIENLRGKRTYEEKKAVKLGFSSLYDYFLIRGIFDKKHNNSNIEKVKFMSPSNKLKVANENDTKKLVKIKGNEAKTYKLTKSLSIKYCRELIETNESNKWLDLFNNHKKKDDLADCFLQGLYFIHNNA